MILLCMSVNNKRPRGVSKSVVKEQPFKLDEDLLCLICTELVVDAFQANCCGGLFCKVCIDLWISGDKKRNRDCLTCRAELTKENIMPDLRSERKSSAHLRRCTLATLSVRVRKFSTACSDAADICTNKRCKTKLATWDLERSSWEAERSSWKTDKSQLEQNIKDLTKTIQVSKKAIGNADFAVKKALKAAAFLSPEEMLRKAYRFDGAKVVAINEAKKYNITALQRDGMPSVKDIEIVITDANCNVSLFARRICKGGEYASAKVFPRLTFSVTLVSWNLADGDSMEDVIDEAELESDLPVDEWFGFPVWMAPGEFNKYVTDGKFAIGWSVAIDP